MFFVPSGSILLEKQGSSTTASYTYGNALVRKDGEFPLFDGQDSERTVTNASQVVTGTLTQSAFGQTVASSGSSSSPYMYAATSGYRNDGDAGLSHVGARYYDAQVGRFITRDTELDQKPYLYCEHDPVNAVDPSGHETVQQYLEGLSQWGSGGAHVGGLIGGAIGGEVNPITTPIIGGVGAMIGGFVGGTAYQLLHPCEGEHDITPQINHVFYAEFPGWIRDGVIDGTIVGAVLKGFRKLKPEKTAE